MQRARSRERFERLLLEAEKGAAGELERALSKREAGSEKRSVNQRPNPAVFISEFKYAIRNPDPSRPSVKAPNARPISVEAAALAASTLARHPVGWLPRSLVPDRSVVD
jgi:hypothetical protein